MMMILPMIIDSSDINLKQYFKFFMDSDLHVNNDDVDKDDE